MSDRENCLANSFRGHVIISIDVEKSGLPFLTLRIVLNFKSFFRGNTEPESSVKSIMIKMLKIHREIEKIKI